MHKQFYFNYCLLFFDPLSNIQPLVKPELYTCITNLLGVHIPFKPVCKINTPQVVSYIYIV